MYLHSQAVGCTLDSNHAFAAYLHDTHIKYIQQHMCKITSGPLRPQPLPHRALCAFIVQHCSTHTIYNMHRRAPPLPCLGQSRLPGAWHEWAHHQHPPFNLRCNGSHCIQAILQAARWGHTTLLQGPAGFHQQSYSCPSPLLLMQTPGPRRSANTQTKHLLQLL